ncbi:hypothetical protein QW180_24840 [Vibrio sinaloensis]|nr:hypothetical protein [Vibrio sinaloensis]
MVGDTLYGSGSFILKTQTEWQTTLTCNPHYHGFRPWLDGIEIWNIGDKAKTFELNSDVVHGSHLKTQPQGVYPPPAMGTRLCAQHAQPQTPHLDEIA